jgi:hypothetical protein
VPRGAGQGELDTQLRPPLSQVSVRQRLVEHTQDVLRGTGEGGGGETGEREAGGGGEGEGLTCRKMPICSELLMVVRFLVVSSYCHNTPSCFLLAMNWMSAFITCSQITLVNYGNQIN